MTYNDCSSHNMQIMQIYYKDNSRTSQLTVLAQQKVR